MADVNQLLSKALSTSSDEEAISCLKMARKIRKGSNTFEANTPNAVLLYKSRTVEQWYEVAQKLHTENKNLKNLYDNVTLRLKEENRTLRIQMRWFLMSMISLMLVSLMVASIVYS